jgi:hypothetical protein
LKIAVIMAVQDIKIFKKTKHAQTHAVAHDFKLMRKPVHGHPIKFFMMREARVHIGVGGINRRVNAPFLKAVGDLKRLIGGAANIRKKGLYGA